MYLGSQYKIYEGFTKYCSIKTDTLISNTRTILNDNIIIAIFYIFLFFLFTKKVFSHNIDNCSEIIINVHS